MISINRVLVAITLLQIIENKIKKIGVGTSNALMVIKNCGVLQNKVPKSLKDQSYLILHNLA